jgi:hypothetical protein
MYLSGKQRTKKRNYDGDKGITAREVNVDKLFGVLDVDSEEIGFVEDEEILQ